MSNSKTPRFWRILYWQAVSILASQGWKILFSRSVGFIIQRYIFQKETSYLYEHTMRERKEAGFLPNISTYTVTVLTSAEQITELSRQGYSNSRELEAYTRRGLDSGAIAFLIFVGFELAHIGWIMMSDRSKAVFDTLPYQVDFENGEACTGGTVTIPRYRGKGLMTYGYYLRFEYLLKQGIVKSRNAVDIGNLASQAVHAKFHPVIYAKVRYLKILWFKHYKEVIFN